MPATGLARNPTPMDQQDDGGGGLTKSAAVAACTAMAVFYVAILYSPTLILRLPPPNSFKSFMLRRFICAAISSIVSLVVCLLILPVRFIFRSRIFCIFRFSIEFLLLDICGLVQSWMSQFALYSRVVCQIRLNYFVLFMLKLLLRLFILVHSLPWELNGVHENEIN